MARCHVRPATPSDFRSFFGRDPPSDTWMADAAWRDGTIVGMGVVVWDAAGQAWGFFDQRGVNRFVMYRTAVAMMRYLREGGVPAMWAHCDRGIDKAEVWLRRLGMHPEPNPYIPGDNTWVIRWA